MRIGTKILILCLTFTLISCKGTTQESEAKNLTAKFDFSKIEKFRDTKIKGQIVNDYDSIFNPEQRKELSNLIYDYSIKTTRQIVVATIDNISPYSNIQKFATDLANYWGVGTAKKNNGLTIVVCNPCRQIGIATGTGTEQILTNEICKEVIENTIIPEFKKGNFYDGIKKSVTELIKKWH